MAIETTLSALDHACLALSSTRLGAGDAVDALCFYLAAGTCVALPLALAGQVFAQVDSPLQQASATGRDNALPGQK